MPKYYEDKYNTMDKKGKLRVSRNYFKRIKS